MAYALAGAGTAPLSLWEAIKQLPKQYWRVLSKPGAATFAEEMGKARWDVVWAQVLGIAAISAVLASLAWIIIAGLFNVWLNSLLTRPGEPNPGADIGFFLLPAPVIGIVVFASSLGGFFLGQGFTYLLAKAFGGQGSFMAQAYTTLLFQVPIGIITSLLSLIPFVGSIGGFAGIYAYVLQVFALMPVHRLSGGKATAVVLIPVAFWTLLVFILVALYFVFIFSIINGLSH
jgi:hypothetical protein